MLPLPKHYSEKVMQCILLPKNLWTKIDIKQRYNTDRKKGVVNRYTIKVAKRIQPTKTNTLKKLKSKYYGYYVGYKGK